MDLTDDMSCLRAYADGRREAAFSAIVHRRINLVYSAALRQLDDAHLAEDVTQSVFIALARKAAALARRDLVVSAWLLSATRLAALDARKRLARRRKHEARATAMNPTQTPEPHEQTWTDIRPLLDAAIAKLGEKDRRAVVLRYFENRSVVEVGAALGVTEEAARQRLWRAIEKLRAHFGAKGAALPASAIAGVVQAHAVQAAPAALAGVVTQTATAIALPAPLFAKGMAYLMAGTKTKVALAAAVAVLLTGSVSTMVYVARKPAAKTVVVKATPSSSELAGIPSSADPNVNPATAMSKCASKLRQIGLGAIMYANGERDFSFPPDVGKLFLTQDLSASTFLDPRRGTRLPPEVAAVPAKQQAAWLNEHSDFLYFGAGKNNARNFHVAGLVDRDNGPDVGADASGTGIKSTDLLAMEKPGDLPRQPGKDIDEINILFGDGHVEAWLADRAIELMEKTIREQEQRK